MHIVGKIFAAIGLVLLVIGGVMYALGSSKVSDAGEWDVIKKSDWNGENGNFTFEGNDGDGDYFVMVRDNVRCDTFQLTFTDSNGTNALYENDECTEDGSKPLGYEDDPSGWYHVGSTWSVESKEYEVNASSEIYLVPAWEVIGEEVGEAIGGFLQGAGGYMLFCCGSVFIIFGLILGFSIGEGNQKITVIQNAGMPMGGQMVQQTTMQQPVYQQVAQTPVQPQTTMEQPADQNIWNQDSPENPF